MSEQKEYLPKWLYHKEQGAKLLTSQAQEDALEGEWKDSPSAITHEAPAEIKNQGDEGLEVKEKLIKTLRKKKDAE